MRSKLFVPASRADRFSKALQSGADAICIDLEDSVLPDQRVPARLQLSNFLNSVSDSGTCRIMVRVNPVDSVDFHADLAASVHPRVSAIVLSKVDSSLQVEHAAQALARVEMSRSISTRIALLPTIETITGLRNALLVASSSPRVIGLQIGFADLLLPLGISSSYSPAREQVRWTLRLAAGEAGVDCYEAAYLDFRDLKGFREELLRARALGFSGASCIHPTQVAVVNEVFQPTDVEIANAREIVKAADAALLCGQGATSITGTLIDAPVVAAARRLLMTCEPGKDAARGTFPVEGTLEHG